MHEQQRYAMREAAEAQESPGEVAAETQSVSLSCESYPQ